MKNKYIAVFNTQVKNLLAYRMNILLKLIRPLVMTFALSALWFVIFSVSGKETIAGFTPMTFVLYLLVIRFVAVFSPGASSIHMMNEDIITGKISIYLVRPINYLKWLFSRNLPIPLVSGVIGLSLLSIVTFSFGLLPFNTLYFGLFLLSVIGTIIVQYAFYQGLGILSFWVYDIWPFDRLFSILRNFISGEIIPLTLFSTTVQQILLYLPFASLAFIPASIFLQMYSIKQSLIFIVTQYAWGVIMWSIIMILFKKGLQKFESQGG